MNKSTAAMRLAVLIGFASSQGVFAASDTWNQTGGSHTWNSGANWLSGTQYPDGVGDVAYFNNDITSGQSVTISPAVTVGGMVIGDANGDNGFFIGAFGNILNIDNGGSATTINNTAAAFNQIRANLTGTGANRDLTVDVAAGTQLWIGDTGVYSPMTIGTFTKNGSGTLGLGTSGSTFTDPNVYLNAGLVQILGSHSLPKTSVVTLGPTAFLMTGGGRAQTVAEIRGVGIASDAGNGPLVVGNDAAASPIGVTIATTGRLRPGDTNAIGQIGKLFLSVASPPSASVRFDTGSESYFDIASYTSFDQIDIQRTFTTINGGDIFISFLGGFVPTNGSRFALFVDTSTQGYRDLNGGDIFDSITLLTAGDPMLKFEAQFAGPTADGEDPLGLGRQRIDFLYVPEPSAALLVLGSGLLSIWRRKVG